MPFSIIWSRSALATTRFCFCPRFLHKKSISAVSMPNLKFVDKEISPEICGHFTNNFVAIEKQTFYCKDSRGDSDNFGAPGGDFGEFLLALDCFRRVAGNSGNSVSSASACDVDEIFEKWLKERCSAERPFYLHSDRPALRRILKSIGQEEAALPEDIKDPLEKEKFIESFGSKADFQGCGHLRLMLEQPEGYSIDLKLFSQLSRAFFTRYFRGDARLMFKVYEITQDGCALVVINGSSDLKTSVLSTQCKNLNPKLNTKDGSSSSHHQVFILNQQAVSAFRKQFLVPFFCKAGKQAKMFEEMETIGWRNAMMSASALAGGKPIYKVDIE